MSTGRYNSGQQGLLTLLRANQAAAKALPEPGETWVTDDVADELAHRIRKFVFSGAVRTVGYANRDTGAREYETTQEAYATAQRINPPTAPCGHTGVRNLGDGIYSCCYDGCDETFGVDVAEEVLG